MTSQIIRDLSKSLSDIRMLADEMRLRSSFRTKYDEYPVMSGSEILDWQDYVRQETHDPIYRIPAELIEIYGITGGFEFRWKCDSDDGLISGAFCLVSLLELYQTDNEQHLTIRECLQTLRRFDDISQDQYAALSLDTDDLQLCCKYLSGDEIIRDDFSPTDYIIAAASHLGVLGWQTADTSRQEQIVLELAAID